MTALSKSHALLGLALTIPMLAIGTPYLGSLIRPDMFMAYYAIAGLAMLVGRDHRPTRQKNH